MPRIQIHKMHQNRSRVVSVGNLFIGGGHPVVIQSMTNTPTGNTDATIKQIMRLADAGCEMVRMAVININEARKLKIIKKTLVSRGYDLPLIADVHFNPEVAETAAQYVEKIRINPGNFIGVNHKKRQFTDKQYSDELKKTEEKLLPLLNVCRKHKTALRIGVNHGSLSDRILIRYGNTKEGMVESAMEFIRICRKYDFENITLSLKASDVHIMVEANKLLVQRMSEEGFYYPVHLGVTEAGDGVDGRLKSAAGIGCLLLSGIGDTIRVSLTEVPENEIPVARKLVDLYGKKDPPPMRVARIILKKPAEEYELLRNIKPPYVVSPGKSSISDLYLEQGKIMIKEKVIGSFRELPLPDNGTTENLSFIKLSYSADPKTVQIRAAAELSFFYNAHPARGVCIYNESVSDDDNAQLSLNILQAMGLRYSRAEFIACPSCGRTRFDIQQHLQKVREKTAHLTGLKIAVMGCVVNGPGEMAGADYGYVGSGKGKINLYKGASLIRKNLAESRAVDALIELIKENGDWKEKEEFPL